MTRDIDSQLRELFLAAASAAVSRIASLDLPIVVSVEQMCVQYREDRTGWNGESRRVDKNVLADREFPVYQLAPLLTPSVREMALACAEELASCSDARLPFFAPVNYDQSWLLSYRLEEDHPPIPPFEEDAVRWTVGHIVFPALQHHLAALRRLDVASEGDATEFAADVMRVARGSALFDQVSVPLAGIHLSPSRKSGLTAGAANIRNLSGEEQGGFLERWGVGHVNPHLPVPSMAFTLRVPTPRDAAPLADPRSGVGSWLCAFYLHGFSPIGREATLSADPKWLRNGSWTSPLRTAENVHESKLLTPSAFAKIHATAQKIDEHNLGEPKSTNDFSLHRFYIGASRSSSADAVVDFVVALESLLLPSDPKVRHGDLTYRFRMHGAHYLSRKKSERTLVLKQLNSLYDLRSNLVHGTKKYPSATAIHDGMNIARDLASRGLLRALGEGFPSHGDLQQMLLGA